ncbi:MAG: M48 family metalloprotease [Bdellovibrionaceae bacterium]|nr:M48 family metalloprotease [Pseudobdellovibrionaceae bacterium]
MSRFIKSLGIALSLCVGLASFQAHAVFVPVEMSGPLDLNDASNSPLTEPVEFTQIVKSIEAIYKPIAKKLGGNLDVKAQWGNNTPNAFAKKMFGSWTVVITGGLARHPKMSKDGIALVVCHEIGHHLAGFPFAQTGIAAILGMDWVANEGESDYYATQVCARKIWANQTKQNEVFRSYASAQVKAECDKVWTKETDQNLCYRTVTASESLAEVLASLSKRGSPQLHTPSLSVVTSTYSGHPEAQCRLDTYLQGAICPMGWNDHVVPGKKLPGGKNGIAAEKQAAMTSCTNASGFTMGLRPSCWYKARM